ncbi:type II toxin-antitoxin system VapC family toxin [Thermococcus sp. JdF3]|uniref:type II toxin-antitoxin system VapC family toxin n=1 Tax=Thermococcus sp. JdF3 TaxID=1638258 RepID=UPI00143953B8|nr:type II toxin-antitoxin system VapC family toxin [Thermococcus sp. JdF3]NJE00608.1 type II toxin-antitoxin system VapC family toxin [Thermococcus sp. JdF3]
MGEGFLIDTNILIYYLADEIPPEELPKVEDILRSSFNVSIITKIEFLGWRGHTPEGFEKSREFIGFAHVIPLTDEIAELAIELRRRGRIKLPDAVIVATALHHDLTLVTRNVKDFEGIEGLRIYNPFEKVDAKD